MSRGRAKDVLCLTLLLMAAWSSAVAQQRAEIVEIPPAGSVSGIKPMMAVRPDPDRSLEAAQLLVSDAGFEAYDASLEQAAGPTWLKLRVAAAPGAGDRHVLTAVRRLFERFEFYVPDGRNELRRLEASFDAPVTAQTVGRNYVFDFQVPPGRTQTLLIFVETAQGNLSPVELSLQTLESFEEFRSNQLLVYGLLFGVLFALIFHNLILYLNLRQRGHLFYVLAMGSLLVLLGIDSGLLQTYLLPEAMSSHSLRLYTVAAFAVLITIGLFFRAFVNPQRQLPRITRVIDGFLILMGILLVATVLVPQPATLTVLLIQQPVQLVFQLLLLFAAFTAGRRGATEGYIFFAAWLVFILSGFSRVFISLGLLPRTDLFEYMIYFGAVVEASVLALGLTWRVRQLYERHARAIEEQHKAARLANLDPLTDAYNRRFLQTYLEEVMPDEPASTFDRAVLILDLDNFKKTNDEYGHAAGDYVLRELVRRCQRELRQGDVMCRLGGDEFVIVLSDQTDRGGLQVAQRIIEEVSAQPFLFEGARMPVTTSIGVVSAVSPRCTVSDVLRMADQALYQAKQAGRNRAVLFDPDKATPFRHGPSRAPLRHQT